jgi:hypothetical protein
LSTAELISGFNRSEECQAGQRRSGLGVSSIKPNLDAGDVDGRQEVGGRLLVAAGDGSEAFDVMEEALDISAKGEIGRRSEQYL